MQLYRHRNEDPDVEDNGLVRLTRRAFPVTTKYDGARLVTRIEGRRVLTPLRDTYDEERRGPAPVTLRRTQSTADFIWPPTPLARARKAIARREAAWKN